MISNALDGKPLPVYGDGLQVRDWLYVDDHCRGILAVLENGRVGEVYNIGGNCPLPNIEVIERVLEIVGAPESLITRSPTVPGTIAATRCAATSWRARPGSRRR